MNRRAATRVRTMIVLIAVACLAISVGLGVLVHDFVASALGFSLAALSLAFTAFLLQDGTFLPRQRPLDSWERWALAATIVLGLALEAAALGLAFARENSSRALMVVGLIPFAGTSLVSLYAMLRSK